MRKSVPIAAAILVTLWSTGAGAQCTTVQSPRQCAAVFARSGVDWFETADGKPVARLEGVVTTDRSGPFRPRVRVLPPVVGAVRFGVEWRVGAFSCVTYEVTYCTR